MHEYAHTLNLRRLVERLESEVEAGARRLVVGVVVRQQVRMRQRLLHRDSARRVKVQQALQKVQRYFSISSLLLNLQQICSESVPTGVAFGYICANGTLGMNGRLRT